MIHPSRVLSKMASTHCGMRRILKRRPSPVQYLKWAVQSGTYKDPDSPRPMSRVYDSSGARVQIQPYPIEYEILSMNPPIPDPPRLTAKMQRKMAKESSVSPLEPLVKNYMRRYDARIRASVPITDAEREEYYYRKTLGISRPVVETINSVMGRKATDLNQAYEFALKQYEIMQQNNGQMTEDESIEAVEKILAEEERRERMKSRQIVEDVSEWRKALEVQEIRKDKKTISVHGEIIPQTPDSNSRSEATATVESSARGLKSTIPSILHSKPRTIRALQLWGQRLKAVPYHQWTQGAATALDHWIAIDVLGMSENTWTKLLYGELESDVEEASGVLQVGNLARARDIINVRGHLFPETIISSMNVDTEREANNFSEEGTDRPKYDAETDRSIDDLLASLGGFDVEKEDSTPESSGTSTDVLEQNKMDHKVSNLVDQLQVWRFKDQTTPFKEWTPDEKKKFEDWLTEYIDLVRSDTDPENIDLDSTRDALLASQPQSRDDDESFWSRVKDETEAEILLQSILAHGRQEAKANETALEKKARDALEVFLSLPYERQLQRLVNLGTLRPLIDEYSKETDRIEFMSSYGEILLEGLEIEHLVLDSNGAITVEDLGDTDFLRHERFDSNARFSIKMIPYGADEFGTSRSERARSLYRAWNIHKAGRAQYEEHLFKHGKTGLKSE